MLGLSVPLFALCGCSNGRTAAPTTGIIDCYSIKVAANGDSTAFSGTYQASVSSVFEYMSESGDYVYTDNHILNRYDGGGDAVIRLYKNRYTNDYTEYSYVGFVGWLTFEKNYYLDLDNRIIDSEQKWSEYLYATNPSTESSTESSVDNKRAYQCAKSGYYRISSVIYSASYYSIRADLVEKTLETHSYTMLGDDSVITYQAKWF